VEGVLMSSILQRFIEKCMKSLFIGIINIVSFAPIAQDIFIINKQIATYKNTVFHGINIDTI